MNTYRTPVLAVFSAALLSVALAACATDTDRTTSPPEARATPAYVPLDESAANALPDLTDPDVRHRFVESVGDGYFNPLPQESDSESGCTL